MVGSRWRAWLEARLPWYHEHTERLRNIRSAIIDRRAAETIDLAQHIRDDYCEADRAMGRER